MIMVIYPLALLAKIIIVTNGTFISDTNDSVNMAHIAFNIFMNKVMLHFL